LDLKYNIGNGLPIKYEFIGDEPTKYNRHWEKLYRYPYKKHRAIFRDLIRGYEARQIVQISGLGEPAKQHCFFRPLTI